METVQKNKREKKTGITSMTQGNPYRLLLFFALPLMAGNVFQQMYTVTDTAIVGRALGVSALAAIGAVDWFNWMALGLVQGITQGFSILMAQQFGAKEYGNLRRTVGNSCVLSVICAAVMLAVMQLLVTPMFTIMGTPEEVIPMGELYLRMMFAGIPIITAYNLASSILRALGDSKTPLYAMVVASLTNIVLDLVFVLVFRWGVAGAAAATLMAQMISAVYCFLRIRKIELLHISRSDLKLEAGLCRKLGILAMPMAFQNVIIAVGGMIVQTVVNRFGVAFIAGYTATNKLYGVLEIAAVSYGYAMTTYAGQNMGAGDHKRISEGVKAGTVIALITSALIGLLMVISGREVLGIFIASDSAQATEALEIGYYYLKLMAVTLPILYILHVTRSCIQGMGNTVIPMMSGVAEFVMRTASAFILPMIVIAETGVLFAEPIAWLGADLVLVPGYLLTQRKLKKR